MVTPDGKIGLGYARISPQHKDHGMGLRDEVDRQLRLRTHGIQAGGIQNHQPLLEKRVRHVDERMAPHGHFHPAIGIHHGVIGFIVVMPEAQRSSLIDGDLAHLGHLEQRVCNLLRIANIQRVLHPCIAAHTPLTQTLGRLTRVNGQKAQAGHQLSLPAQLCRAHGGAACARRHEAAAVVGKENSVDQL